MPTLPSSGLYAGDGHRLPVLLKDVVTMERKTGPETIDHYDLQRAVDVMFGVAGNDLGAVARRVEHALAGVTLPKDVTTAVKGGLDSMRATIPGFTVTLPLAAGALGPVTGGGVLSDWRPPRALRGPSR